MMMLNHPFRSLRRILTPLIAAIAVFTSTDARAAIIQILHTNDLHAALQTAGEPKAGEPEFGGWAEIKTLMDRLTEEAAHPTDPNIPPMETLRLDAGDFLEGTLQYFPRNGINILHAYNKMGYDITTLGNHDWLMGARALDALVQPTPSPSPGSLEQLAPTEPFAQPLVSANIQVNPRLKNLSSQIQPYKIIEKAGVKLGIFGLATNEAFYSWIPKVRSKKSDFKLKSYRDREGLEDESGVREIIPGIANQTIQALRPQVNAVIALTHIGFDEDLAVAQESRGLDLIVGGHSHTFLETLNVERDRDGHDVPIVQAGYNGRTIGRIVLEVIPDQPARVLTYELIPVPHETAKDPVIASITDTAERDLTEMYGPERLNEVIGTSEVQLVPGKYGPTAFSKFAVDAIRKSIDASIGMDSGAFHANTPLPGGSVTRRKLMEMYPRKLEGDQNQGLYVYSAKMPGFAIAIGLKYAVKYGLFTSFSGLDYREQKLTDAEYAAELKKAKPEDREIITRVRAKRITVNGARICLTCTYDIALPEFLVRGAYGITPLSRLVIWSGKRTPITIWSAFERHLRDIGVIRALDDGEHFIPNRFRNSYVARFGKHLDPNQTSPQTRDASGLPDHTFHRETPMKDLYERFLTKVLKVKKSKKLDKNTDADSPVIENEL
jgi:2',3'-cyclic-nucleotide 2'-phosphodiesterase (5'-nucleotidase family)